MVKSVQVERKTSWVVEVVEAPQSVWTAGIAFREGRSGGGIKMDYREAYIRSAGTIKDAMLQLLEPLDADDIVWLLWSAADWLLTTSQQLTLVRRILLSVFADNFDDKELWKALEVAYSRIATVSQEYRGRRDK